MSYILAPGVPRAAGPPASLFPLAALKGSSEPCSKSGAQAPGRQLLQGYGCFSDLVLPDRAASLVNIDGGLRQRGTRKQRALYL